MLEVKRIILHYLLHFHSETAGPPRLAEEGTSLLCKSAPDICASNPQSISYVDKADLSQMLPVYSNAKPGDPRFTIVEKVDQNIVDSRLSGFVDKEGLMDSRMLSESRQNMIAFTETKDHPVGQAPIYVSEMPCRIEPQVNR